MYSSDHRDRERGRLKPGNRKLRGRVPPRARVLKFLFAIAPLVAKVVELAIEAIRHFR
jgi:hypothetical protein